MGTRWMSVLLLKKSNGYLVALLGVRDLSLESIDAGYIEYPSNTADWI